MVLLCGMNSRKFSFSAANVETAASKLLFLPSFSVCVPAGFSGSFFPPSNALMLELPNRSHSHQGSLAPSPDKPVCASRAGMLDATTGFSCVFP